MEQHDDGGVLRLLQGAFGIDIIAGPFDGVLPRASREGSAVGQPSELQESGAGRRSRGVMESGIVLTQGGSCRKADRGRLGSKPVLQGRVRESWMCEGPMDGWTQGEPASQRGRLGNGDSDSPPALPR